MSFSGFTSMLLLVVSALPAATDLHSVNPGAGPGSRRPPSFSLADLHITPKHVSHGQSQSQPVATPEAASSLRLSPKARGRPSPESGRPNRSSTPSGRTKVPSLSDIKAAIRRITEYKARSGESRASKASGRGSAPSGSRHPNRNPSPSSCTKAPRISLPVGIQRRVDLQPRRSLPARMHLKPRHVPCYSCEFKLKDPRRWVPAYTGSLGHDELEQFARAEKAKTLWGTSAAVPDNAMRYDDLQRKYIRGGSGALECPQHKVCEVNDTMRDTDWYNPYGQGVTAASPGSEASDISILDRDVIQQAIPDLPPTPTHVTAEYKKKRRAQTSLDKWLSSGDCW